MQTSIDRTFRFIDAVCSGSVPVLVTDKMVPPFDELVPFESYGVLVGTCRGTINPALL